jgi:hypothetical protein
LKKAGYQELKLLEIAGVKIIRNPSAEPEFVLLSGHKLKYSSS